MPEIRCCDENHVEIFFGKHFFGIEVALRHVPEHVFDPGSRSAKAVFHDVANRDVVHPLDILHRVEKNLVLFAAADEADSKLFRWRILRLCTEDGRGSENETGTGNGSLLQKIASFYVGWLIHDAIKDY